MRALSVRQPWAELIAQGKKKIEYRSWMTKTLGDLLIVASASRQDGLCRDNGLDPDALTYGRAVCVVEVEKISRKDDEYRWHLRNPRRVEPLPLKGSAALYHVDDAKIQFATRGTRTRVKQAPKPKTSRKKIAVDAPHVVVATRERARAARWVAALRSRGIRTSSCADGYAAWLEASARPGASVLVDHRVQGYSALDIASRLGDSAAHGNAFTFIVGGVRMGRFARTKWIKGGAGADELAEFVARAIAPTSES